MRRHPYYQRKKRKIQTGILTYPLQQRTPPKLVDTRQMENRHLVMQGQFRYHYDLRSAYLKPSRTVIVYLPPGYNEDPRYRYPVLYMHDGNNLFDPATGFMGREWRLDESIEYLIRANKIPPLIVVGIYNTPDRLHEYTWHPHIFQGEPCGGWGLQYAKFIAHELKPLIDSSYRTLPTREYTGLMGSSLGALISFYIACEYPQLFSKIGMMSPTVYWAHHQLLHDAYHFPRHTKLWVDIGTEEGWDPNTEETVESTQIFVEALKYNGVPSEEDLAFYIDYWVGHDEMAWGNRVAHPLTFLYGKTQHG